MSSSTSTARLTPVLLPRALGWFTRLWLQQSARAAARFAQAARQPQQAQEKYLRRLLATNQRTDYGSAHNFGRIDSITAYQAKVPIVDYDALVPWIEQIVQGRQGLLSAGPVLGLRARHTNNKALQTIPVTAAGVQDNAAALLPWLYDTLARYPQLATQSLFWEAPLAVEKNETTARLPLMSFDCHQAFGPRVGKALTKRTVTALPKLSTNLAHMLQRDDLGAMVLHSPAYAAALIEALQTDLADILADLPDRRAAAIRAGLDREGHLCAAALWPQLRLVFFCRDAVTEGLTLDLASFFATALLRSGPVVTAEAILTSPRSGQHDGDMLAVNSHFFEFIDLDQPRRPPLLAHNLRKGGTYQPIVSTAAGLYRYRLDECVHCEGYTLGTPMLTYVDQASPRSNLRGEQLAPERVARALRQACHQSNVTHRFALCAPRNQGPMGYRLYIESDCTDAALQHMAHAMERGLTEDYAYWSCRRSGALQALEVVRVRGGWQSYRRAHGDTAHQPNYLRPTILDAVAF